MVPQTLLRKVLPSRNLLKTSDYARRPASISAQSALTPITSILIANRGEIALRVCRTASQQGIRTTSIFTDPDALSEHTLASPFSIGLGDASAYLDGEKIIQAAKAHGCDAVHPGYGFLSENALFARQCAEAGLNFIGPSSGAIEAMGDKSRSKEIMLAANVPCTPGYHGPNQDPAFLQEQANGIGYPVLLKAVHGGGGKGMRIAQTPEVFASQLESAKCEARNSFGSDTMLVEKYITRPRHVEVQIFGDKHGNVVALGERDCSVQRRHQKIIEESPAPGLSNSQRSDLWQKAIQAGKAVNYVGAGTVEFILDSDSGLFYFMETNTRLQVEHPVTEMCTGLDLVEWQVRVARGEVLPLRQAQITERIAERGHAVEARIYAEDPAMDFLPTAGTLTHIKLPKEEHDSVRIDTAISKAPNTVSSHYDPMISKLIVRAPDRETAMMKLHIALEQYEVAGLTTNIEFLKQLCRNQHFAGDVADLDTGFIAKYYDELFPAKTIAREVWVQAALGLLLHERHARPALSGLNNALGFSTAEAGAHGFRVRTFELAAAASPAAATSPNPTVMIEIQQSSADRFTASINSSSSDVSEEAHSQTFPNVTATLGSTDNPQAFVLSTLFPQTRLTSTIVLPSTRTTAEYKPTITIFDRGTRHDLTVPPPVWLSKALGKSAASSEASVTAPMPSKILRVETREGAEVKKDQPLVIVESMKMEMVIRAPKDGLVVKKVVYKPGEICKAGAVLVEFQEPVVQNENSQT